METEQRNATALGHRKNLPVIKKWKTTLIFVCEVGTVEY
jgi:hypothetical protein